MNLKKVFIALFIAFFINNLLLLNFSKAQEANGTTDTGGGNAISGQMLDSKIWSPEETVPFKKYLKGIYKKFLRYNSNNKSTFINFKEWYFLSNSLPKIDDSILGVTLNKRSQQVAIQRLINIQVDSDIYNSMSSKDQAWVILHETVMMIYLTQFLTYEEYLKRQLHIFVKVELPPLKSLIMQLLSEQLWQSFPPRPLNNQDYENIRHITNWLFINGSKKSKDDFYNEAIRYNFPFFKTKILLDIQDATKENKSSISQSVTTTIGNPNFSSIDQSIALEATRLNGSFENQSCRNPETNETYPCEIDWIIKDDELSSEIKVVDFKIKKSRENDPPSFISSGFFNLNPYAKENHDHAFTINVNNKLSTTEFGSPVNNIARYPYKKGDIIQSIFLNFSEKRDQLIGLGILPYICTGITGEGSDKTAHFTRLLKSQIQQPVIWAKDSLNLSIQLVSFSFYPISLTLKQP